MRWFLHGVMGMLLLICLPPGHAGILGVTPRLISPLAAQTMDFVVEGTISRHEPGKLTINSEGNIIFRARYDDQTTIRHEDGSPASAKDLRVGIKIRIEGELPESGEIIAHRITLL
jgi:hypothetical protein